MGDYTMRLRRDQIAFIAFLSVIGACAGGVLFGEQLGLSAYSANRLVAAGFGVQFPLMIAKLPLPKTWSERINSNQGFALRSVAILALSLVVGRQIGFLAAVAMLLSGTVASAFVPLLREEVG